MIKNRISTMDLDSFVSNQLDKFIFLAISYLSLLVCFLEELDIQALLEGYQN